MTHQAPPQPAAPGADPGRQLAQLRELLRLVERIAGTSTPEGQDALLDEAARISGAYDEALPVVQRRFDALAAEAADWAAAGVEALLAGSAAPSRAAAARLAGEIGAALDRLRRLIGA